MSLDKSRLLGHRNGALEVIEIVVPEMDKRGKYKYRAIYKCDCGCIEEKPLDTRTLQRTGCRSCGSRTGCNNPKIYSRKHEELLRRKYLSITQRCYNESKDSYKYYGGRGIIVEEPWRSNYNSFYLWAIENYSLGLEIDRIDNDGNYSPRNCRLVDRITNCNNRRKPESKTNDLPLYITKSFIPDKPYKVQCKGSYLGCFKNLDKAIDVASKFEREYKNALGKN